MRASIWKFTGDPDDLLAAYDAMLAELPTANMRLHLCLRAPDGVVMIDTCPDRETFEQFSRGDGFRALRERHGLPAPTQLDDYAVHVAITDGHVAAAAS